jgi:Ca2+-binding RTX toxin-like protein
VDYVLATHVEHLTLTGSAAINGTGNALNNTIIGNGLNNNLSGLDGNDRLDGGVGADTLTGGIGDDIYVVDNVNDTVVETSGQGTDTVEASIDYTLSDTVENLTLIGSAISGWGNASNNTITGNGQNNNLSGMDGDDRLDGGAGIDTLSGGNGNDTYVVDHSSDVVLESPGQGTDSVESSASYTLPSEVETLLLTGGAGINGTGNELPNTITGNSGANTLDGGSGADTLSGGYGHDIYIVDNAGDVVTEVTNAGTDSVQSSVDYVLTVNVENLTLIGSVAINGTGNALNNVIIGNSLNNNLIGWDGDDRLEGGAGADTLTGGNGNDSYVVDDVGDLVVEISAGGTDTVESTITYTLPNEVERLTLSAGSAISGYGNSLSNIITGNSNANLLDGGAGSDTLIGGDGSDTYVVDNAGDVVTELLNKGTDWIQSSITYTLPGHVENLDLTGVANINATGNSLQNTIRGNAGNNIIAGGGGTDTLSGGLGVDTFLIRDGFAVTVTDLGAGGRDILSISNTSSVTAQCTSDWTATTATVNDGVATINSNGFVVNLSAATGANGFSINNNSAQNSVLIGTDKNDVLISQSGSDNLSGGSGDDAFVGGGGYDAIFGGDGIDTLRLTGTVANYKVTRIADGYKVVDIRLNGDGTASCYQVEKVFLINSNTTLNLADLANTYAPSSASKTISFPEDSRYTLMSSDFKFLDQDIGQTLEKVIIARLPNAGHIWLDGYIVDLNQQIPIADVNAKKLSYVPPPDKSGKNLATWGFKVHDGFVASAISYNMTFNVTPINDAPVLDEEIPDQTVLEGSRFTLNVKQNFRDVDSGDQLTLSAALSDGKPLPSWLKFNASTGVFSGTPLDADSNKSLNIVVTATDKLKLKTSDQFSLAITGVNMPPVAKPITKMATATENESFVFVLPFETFTNNELGDALTYSATGLPPGVVINPDTGTLTGRLSFTAADIPLRTVTLKATDRYGLVATTDLKMKINNVPTIAGTTAADTLVGGIGSDYITGGNGNDTLTGGAGNDQFRFNVLPSLSNKDKILDFTSGTDRLYFDKKILTSIVGATGQIASEIYTQQSSSAATSPSQRLIFDRSTSTLYYDVDGNGGMAPLGLVELVGVNNLPITDLFLY